MALSLNQLYVLKLLDLAGKIEGKTKFQKIVFLAETEEKSPMSYKFEKYHYGPFSFDLSDDVDALSKTGFILEEKTIIGASEGKAIIKSAFSITQDGKKELDVNKENLSEEGIKSISEVLKKWNDASLEKVLNYVYSKYMNDNNRELTITR